MSILQLNGISKNFGSGEQQAEVLLEAQGIDVGQVALSLPGASHAGQMQGVQFFDRGMGQHEANSPIVEDGSVVITGAAHVVVSDRRGGRRRGR